MANAMAKTRARRALVVGLGRTGVSVARHLTARGWTVAVTDTRPNPPGLEPLRAVAPDAAVFLGGYSEEALRHADEIVLSPGVALSHPFLREAAAQGLSIVGDVELFAREVRGAVVAVTGSNGKSTVTTLVGLMAERAGRRVKVGGNLGTPALDLLDDEPGAAPTELYVLELSSFQLETTSSLKPAAAVVLNISPDHMDRYADLAAYAAAKARVFRGCAVALVNRADAVVAAMPALGAKRISFGPDAPPGANDWGVVERGTTSFLARGGDALFPVESLLTRGAHNVQNSLAAAALGNAVGLEVEAIGETLREFRGLPHRTEFVAERGGVVWLNDSKGTNVGATLAAIEGLGGPLLLILGGDGKGQDFAPLAEALVGKTRAAVLLGRDAAQIERAIRAAAAAAPGEAPELRRVASIEQAVSTAAELAVDGDTVLLSPACSSLDMFESFEHRGRAFCNAVRRLGA
jgi:UDP-N-acetylmuramoylalanine--D-glutamate ligase